MESQSIDEQLRRTFFDALGELLSPVEISSLIDAEGRQPYACRQISACLDALVARYRPSLGRGLAMRAGRVAFKYGLRYLEPLEELKTLSYRLMPAMAKIRRSLSIFSNIFSPRLIESISIDERDDRFIWRNSVGSECLPGRIAWIHGFIQEGLYWVSNGKFYLIEEVIEEEAERRECLLLIPKKALE